MDEYKVRHAPQSRFDYWKERVTTAKRQKEIETEEHRALMDQWPSRKTARQTLDLQMRERNDCDYMQQGSLRGKSNYKFHKKGWRIYLPVKNVIHICLDKDDDVELPESISSDLRNGETLHGTAGDVA